MSAMTSVQITATRRLLGISEGAFGDARLWRARLAEICGMEIIERAESAD